MQSIHFGSKDRSHSLVYQPLRITLSLCVCGFSPRSLKTIPCGETIYQGFCLYTSSLLRCHRALPPYFIVPPSSSFLSSLQPPLTACLIVFVRVHCILNALPRELTICAVESQTDYLPCLGSQYGRSSLVFDDTEPFFDEDCFKKCDWAEYYPNAGDDEPPRAPELRGRSINTSCFVDADHAGCRVRRRLHTGVLIFVNQAPILWYSKR